MERYADVDVTEGTEKLPEELLAEHLSVAFKKPT